MVSSHRSREIDHGNFGLAEQFGGQCHLRFDDTNPEKESQEFIDSIQEDVRWLGISGRESALRLKLFRAALSVGFVSR